MKLELSTTFKSILILAIVAVAIVSGIYYYSQVSSKAVAAANPVLRPASFIVSNLTVAPTETSINQPAVVTVKVENLGQQTGNYSADLWINGTLRESKPLTLSGGQNSTVDFTLIEPNSGIYGIYIGNLSSTLKIDAPIAATPAPTPQPTITIGSGNSGTGGSGGSSSGSSGGSRSWTSCPSLFVWNGTGYVHASEVSDGPGWLGFVDYYNADGSIVFANSDPWSYMKLNPSILQPVNGYYDMSITEQSNEIFYLDSVKILTVDHSPNVDVYSTRGTYLYSLWGPGTIYTVSKNPATPLSAINNGENVLLQISKIDSNYTTATRWTWNTLELNLGNLASAKEIKLVVNAVTSWPTNEAGGNWASQFSSQPGVTPSPPPYMEIKDANGKWVKVSDDREFPIPPVDSSNFVVNLTGIFLTNDYSLRIHYYQDYRFDYLGVDTTAQQNMSIHEPSLYSATFNQAFKTNSTSSGNFTSYGDVAGLVLIPDDMYVVGRQGDSVQLKFTDEKPVPQGMVRDYFVVASTWFKGEGLLYVPYTVDALPFHSMTSYPYPSSEGYPSDIAHSRYISEYNTREISAQNAEQSIQLASSVDKQVRDFELLASCVAFTILIGLPAVIFAYRRKRHEEQDKMVSNWVGDGNINCWFGRFLF